jgi:hypothetical protein
MTAPTVTEPVVSTATPPTDDTAALQPVAEALPAMIVAGKPCEAEVETLLAALKAQEDKLELLVAGSQRDREHKRLIFGAIRKSKLFPVKSTDDLFGFVMALNDPTATKSLLRSVYQHPKHDDVTVYRFTIPAGYNAFSRMIRLGELLERNHRYAWEVHPVRIVDELGVATVKFHAPKLEPLSTDVVTFHVKDGCLVAWHAGEDPSVFQLFDNSDCWVHCGVNLLKE